MALKSVNDVMALKSVNDVLALNNYHTDYRDQDKNCKHYLSTNFILYFDIFGISSKSLIVYA